MNAFIRSIFILSIGLISCTPQEETASYKKPLTTGVGGASPTEGTREGRDFFKGKITAAFRQSSAGCLNCHDAPRNVLNNPDASDERIYDYGRMFAKLKIGGFTNFNSFINPILGNSNHPGGSACNDISDTLCQLAVQWHKIEFPDAKSQFGVVDGVDISFDGINISGSAQDVSNPDVNLNIRAYLDGEAGTGTMVGSGDTGGALNSFNFRLTNMTRDNSEHMLYIYAMVDGKEEPLGGSPLEFTAYGPRGDATFPGSNAIYNGGCNCHAGPFSYSSLWPDLIIPIGGANGEQAKNGVKASAMNNYLIDMASGARGTAHPGGRVGNQAVIRSWWCAEFDPNNNNCENQ